MNLLFDACVEISPARLRHVVNIVEARTIVFKSVVPRPRLEGENLLTEAVVFVFAELLLEKVVPVESFEEDEKCDEAGKKARGRWGRVSKSKSKSKSISIRNVGIPTDCRGMC